MRAPYVIALLVCLSGCIGTKPKPIFTDSVDAALADLSPPAGDARMPAHEDGAMQSPDASVDAPVSNPDLTTPPDGSVPECAAQMHQWADCNHDGDQCVTSCSLCGAELWTLDPIVWQCQPNPASGNQLQWVSLSTVDCFFRTGHCPNTFTDAQCTTALNCSDCGEGADCGSDGDCCDVTLTCINARCGTCHAPGYSCANGYPCCNGDPCDPRTRTCPEVM